MGHDDEGVSCNPKKRSGFTGALLLLPAPRCAVGLTVSCTFSVSGRGLLDHALLRDLRREAGLNQSEVAAEIGVSRRTVIRWERGTFRVPRKRVGVLYALLSDETRTEEIKSRRSKQDLTSDPGYGNL